MIPLCKGFVPVKKLEPSSCGRKFIRLFSVITNTRDTSTGWFTVCYLFLQTPLRSTHVVTKEFVPVRMLEPGSCESCRRSYVRLDFLQAAFHSCSRFLELIFRNCTDMVFTPRKTTGRLIFLNRLHCYCFNTT